LHPVVTVGRFARVADIIKVAAAAAVAVWYISIIIPSLLEIHII
jgi:hypothetical protein